MHRVPEPRRDRTRCRRLADPPATASPAVPRRHRVPLLRRPGRAGGDVPERASSMLRRVSRRRWQPSSVRGRGAALLRYPGATLTAVAAQPAARPSGVRDAGDPHGVARRHRPGQLTSLRSAALAARPPTRSHRRRRCSTRRRTRPSRTTAPRPSKALERRRLDEDDNGWHLTASKKPLTLEVISPTEAVNRELYPRPRMS